jgi:S1-C subfamily serine protease
VRLVLRLLVGLLAVWLVAALAGVPLALDLGRRAADRAEGIARALNPPAPTLRQTPATPQPSARPSPPPVGTPAGVTSALASVVQILVSSCGHGEAGSGFVAGRQRVVTNAHVVAGASRVVVRTELGDELAARVVLYDTAADTAVLAVQGLSAVPLRPAPAEAAEGAPAWVAGHPLAGPLKVVRASIEGISGATGSDGEAYVLHTVVRPGNSGGPLLDARGRVLGVVYATAANGDPQGYARTWPAVEDEVAAGTRATASVGVGSC